ncbi:MAG: porin family protein [Nonlabens sp.]
MKPIHYFILLLCISNIAICQTFNEGKSDHWAQPLHLKISYGNNFGGSTDLSVSGFKNAYENYGSLRVGIGYDFTINNKWIFRPSLQLDYDTEKEITTLGPDAFEDGRAFSIASDGGLNLEYIVEGIFEYSLFENKNSRIGLNIGPQFILNPDTIFGGASYNAVNGDERLAYEETNVNNNLFRVAGQIGLSYTTKFGNTPIRLETFYSHSFVDQKSGSFEYSNTFNGEMQNGNYNFKAHKLSLGLSIFAFGQGKPKEQSVFTREDQTVEEEPKDFTWGLKVGYNEGDIAATDINTGELSGILEPSVYAGFHFTNRFTEKWAARSEVLYSTIEAISIVQIPLQAKYTFLEDLSVFAGPNLNYIVDQADVEDIITNRFGVGIDAGLEYFFSKDFFIEARYNYGLNNQFEDRLLDYENGRYSSLRFGIGVNF